jgi:hypothetical protein
MNELGDMDKKHAEMALRSMERAIAGLRFIEENAPEFRELFPGVWADLNNAHHYLNTLTNPCKSRPLFLYN